jgi:hypothetical protein
MLIVQAFADAMANIAITVAPTLDTKQLDVGQTAGNRLRVNAEFAKEFTGTKTAWGAPGMEELMMNSCLSHVQFV